MTKAQAAWLAGLFDGEGCVSFERWANKGSSCYRVRARLVMTHAPTIRRVQEIVGFGSFYSKDRGPTRKAAFHFELGAKQARRFLEAILPHSVTKAEEIGAVLAADAVRAARAKSYRIPAEVVAELTKRSHEVSRLKLVEYDPVSASQRERKDVAVGND